MPLPFISVIKPDTKLLPSFEIINHRSFTKLKKKREKESPKEVSKFSYYRKEKEMQNNGTQSLFGQVKE